MKKGILINSEVSYVISKLGHGDSLVVADSGLPVPKEVLRIDLAVKKGIPTLLDVLGTILTEQRVEEIVVAAEMQEKSPELYKNIINMLKDYEKTENIKLKMAEIPHEQFKAETERAQAVVRTGEHTSYGNIILKSGVVF